MKSKTAVQATLLTFFGIWLLLGFMRFFFSSNYEVHYHADFAVYINGQQFTFDNPLYYEEVGSGCTLSEDSEPEERAHLHDNVGSVIHVHDRNVTWGNFFNNIDYSIGEYHIETWEDVFAETDQQQVRFILNGKEIQDIKNQVIESEDKLLVDYSADNEEVLQERFASISGDAAQYNSQPDPSSCKGSGSSTAEKLKNAFLFL